MPDANGDGDGWWWWWCCCCSRCWLLVLATALGGVLDAKARACARMHDASAAARWPTLVGPRRRGQLRNGRRAWPAGGIDWLTIDTCSSSSSRAFGQSDCRRPSGDGGGGGGRRCETVSKTTTTTAAAATAAVVVMVMVMNSLSCRA
jgi:hypothetical protein